MKLRLKRIEPISAGKIMGGLYAALSLLIVPFFLMMGLFATLASHASVNMSMQSSGSMGGPMLPGVGMFAGMGIFFALMMPVIYGVFGFLMGALLALVHNLIARWLGGLELEFDVPGAATAAVTSLASEPPPPPLPPRE